MFYKQHMIKKTSWTFLDFIQSLLISVAQFKKNDKKFKIAYYFVDNWLFTWFVNKNVY